MKIVVINGSPRSKASNINVMVTAFLKGAQEAGAETVNIFLAEKELANCGVHDPYWFHHPGQCMTKDDVVKILILGARTTLIVLATPVYFENISGILNVFMDRLALTDSPHFARDKFPLPKLMIISSCGFAERSRNQVISLWIKRVALKMHTEVIGEIHAAQGRFLIEPTEELRPLIGSYLTILENAGKEIATNMNLSVTTKCLLENNVMSEYACNVANKR